MVRNITRAHNVHVVKNRMGV